MLKQFFVSFLGGLVGTWTAFFVSAGMAFLFFFMFLIALGSDASGGRVSDNAILYIPMQGEFVDRSDGSSELLSLYGLGDESIAVNDVIAALDRAADDDKVSGVYIDCMGSAPGLANCEEIVGAIDRFKTKSGKWVVAYGDSYSQSEYMIASHADSIFLNPLGSVDIHGLGSMVPFFKTLLDNLGVEMQVLKVGTFKSAVEPYILTSMSEPARLQQEVFLNNMWKQVRETIASGRSGVNAADLDSIANKVMMAVDPGTVHSLGLVDALRYRHEVEEMLMERTDCSSLKELNLMTPSEYLGSSSDDMQMIAAFSGNDERNLDLEKGDADKVIAVIYAVGDIVDTGEEGISAEVYVPMIVDLIDNDDIDGLILRVNSGGGSAFASEQIWEALKLFKERTGKPFYVSMGDYAASGGYYISCGADRIYADPTTLTGSIGIFGMIPNIKGTLNNHLGINMDAVATNPNAIFPTLAAPMTPAQRDAMQAYIERGYETFVSRVAEGRSLSVDSVKTIAEGRVWDGATAKSINLVDELGGLDATVAAMAEQMGCSVDDIYLAEYPSLEMNIFKSLRSFKMVSMEMLGLTPATDLDPALMQAITNLSKIQSMNPVQCRMEVMIVK